MGLGGLAIDPFDDSRAMGRSELLTLLDQLIMEARGVPKWENSTIESYMGAMVGWLADQRTVAPGSLDRRMMGHILSPPGTFRTLADYFVAVRSRVETPDSGWPPHLAKPEPDWRTIGKALSAACVYE